MSAPLHNPSNTAGNYVRISRELAEHVLVGFGQPVKPADASRGSYSRAEAWLFLVFKARWDTAEVNNKGKVMTLQRGELIAARKWLSQVWNWTENQVRWFLDKLEDEDMIERRNHQSDNQKRAHYANVISLCNYNLYQSAIDRFIQSVTQQDNQSTTNQPPHIKEIKGIKINTDASAPELREYPAMVARMELAAGECLANLANAPGLMSFTDLKRWLDGGCDFEQHILLGIAKAARGRRPRTIQSWLYFEKSILEFRDAGNRVLAQPDPNARGAPPGESEWNRKQREERENREKINRARAELAEKRNSNRVQS